MRLVADRLVRSFGTRRIVGPLDVTLEAGRVLGVAGANGSGKTTLLKTVAGLLRPTSGTVQLEEGGASRPTRDVPGRIGWFAPDLALYGELTPAENLVFFARLAGRVSDRAATDGRLAAVGLDPRRVAGLPSRALSTGQRQRLKLAYATLHQPALLLLDEPGANLDAAGREIVRLVVEAQRAHGAVMIASNDPGDLALADETVRL